jgi:hypothetical protein
MSHVVPEHAVRAARSRVETDGGLLIIGLLNGLLFSSAIYLAAWWLLS